MQLTPEQIRAGLLHDDVDVRQRCLNHFTDKWSLDESVMPLVTQVIDARGFDAFPYLQSLDQLAQTDATIAWVVRSLRQTPDFFHKRYINDWRPFILTQARGELLLRHRQDVLSVLEPRNQAKVNRRLEMLSESPAVLWNRLEILCEQHKSAEDWDEFPQEEADDLVMCLAELGSVPIERLMELLQTDVPDEGDSAIFWLEPKLVTLAGLIRHQPALPILVEKLRLGSDFLDDESQTALIRLGTDEVVRTIASLLPQEECSWQRNASRVLEHIHSDETVRVATELLRDDSLIDEIRQNIAHGLACQYSTEGLQTITEYLESHTDWLDDPEWDATLQQMDVAAKLLHVELPRLKEWKGQLEEAIDSGRASIFRRPGHWKEYDVDDFDDDFVDDNDDEEFVDDDYYLKPAPPATVIHESPRVGRNEPCPCGSGKKFKKCCLNKTANN